MSSGSKFSGIGWNQNKICGDEQKNYYKIQNTWKKSINHYGKYNKDCDVVVNNINELRILQNQVFLKAQHFLLQ